MIEGLRAPAARRRASFELVHRLDWDTRRAAGGEKLPALRSLHEQLRDKGMQKDYLALVRARWQSAYRSGPGLRW